MPNAQLGTIGRALPVAWNMQSTRSLCKVTSGGSMQDLEKWGTIFIKCIGGC